MKTIFIIAVISAAALGAISGCATTKCWSLDGKQTSWCEGKIKAEKACAYSGVKYYSPLWAVCNDGGRHEF